MKHSLLFAFLVAATGVSSGLTLSERGRPSVFGIVVDPALGPSYRYAAEELRDWTEKLTGERLAIGQSPKLRRIVLSAPEPGSDLGTEGFRLQVKGTDLHVVGGKRGILYGVYELLETYGGIGWYASWRTVVPEAERFEVPDDLDRTEMPAFELRARSWRDPLADPDFACRLRFNGATHRPYLERGTFGEKHGGTGWRIGDKGGCHTLCELVPLHVHGKTHPEYFAEIDGRRRTTGSVQPCLTNPDVLEIVTTNLFARIRKDPTAECFDVSQNDYPNFCTCAKCKAVDDAEGSHAGTMLRFVNAVAERVERAFPGKQVCTLAYRYTRAVPKLTRPRRNVVMRLCSIECDMSAPLGVSRFKDNLAFEKDLAGWAAISPHLYVWDYSVNFQNYLHTFPNARTLLPNMKTFLGHGARYMLEQGDSQGLYADFGELKVWLIAKGLWNPDQDVEKLIDRFMKGYYGPAAAEVRACFDLLNAPPRDTEMLPALIYENAYDRRRVSDETLERAAELWARAESAAKDDPECLRNVRMSAAGVTFSRLERMAVGVKEFWVTREPRRFVPDSRLPNLLERMRQFERMAGKACRYSEKDAVDSRTRARWQAVASLKGCESPSDSVVVGVEGLVLDKPGKYGDYVDDAAAFGGRAVQLYDRQYDWCLRFSYNRLAYDPGVKYRVRVHVKPLLTGADGEVFYAGLYDRRHDPQNVSWCHFKRDDVSSGYAWYDLGAFVPTEDAIVWFSSAKPTGAGVPRAAKGVLVDAVEISREGDSVDR